MGEGLGGPRYRCRECRQERTDWEEATPVRASADRGRAQHLLCPDCRERVVEQGRMRRGSPLLGKRQRC